MSKIFLRCDNCTNLHDDGYEFYSCNKCGKELCGSCKIECSICGDMFCYECLSYHDQ